MRTIKRVILWSLAVICLIALICGGLIAYRYKGVLLYYYHHWDAVEVFVKDYKQYPHLHDVNYKHLRAARGLNKEVFTDKNFVKRRAKLKEVEGNDDYYLSVMFASIPYLLPKGKQLLDDIASDFHQELKQRKLRDYKIKVTSLLRTVESQKRLTHRNANAATNSAHCYGTTFDISWSSFLESGHSGKRAKGVELKAILADVLLRYKKKNRCYVIHERRQPCFHITVR